VLRTDRSPRPLGCHFVCVGSRRRAISRPKRREGDERYRSPDSCGGSSPHAATCRPFVARRLLRLANEADRARLVVRQSTARKSLDLGLRNYTREDLEAARRAGEMLQINVLGLATIAQDVTAELARATIASVSVLGALHATPAVKAALADRTR
jgi:Ribbon-Helix-Helix transcriptional regulator family